VPDDVYARLISDGMRRISRLGAAAGAAARWGNDGDILREELRELLTGTHPLLLPSGPRPGSSVSEFHDWLGDTLDDPNKHKLVRSGLTKSHRLVQKYFQGAAATLIVTDRGGKETEITVTKSNIRSVRVAMATRGRTDMSTLDRASLILEALLRVHISKVGGASKRKVSPVSMSCTMAGV